MSRKIVTTAHIESGKLVVHHKRDFLDRCAKVKGRGRLTFEKDTRSLQQNALLWLWETIISKEWGWEPEEVHEHNKDIYNRIHKMRIDKRTGELIDESFPGPTKTLPKDRFAVYMDRLQREYAQQGITLPSTEEEFYEWESKRK